MSATEAQRARVLRYYDGCARWMKPQVERFSKDADATLAAGREIFEGMIDRLPYVDRPDHTMAPSMFGSASLLAAFLALREGGVDVHAWGAAIQELPPVLGEPTEASRERERRDSVDSQDGAQPNEFVWELVDEDEHGDRGMDITSCAICHLFGGSGAMELVPYMCAYDDTSSDAGNQGLRRSGTIALGAKRCDFRFRPEGEPRPLAPQYPDRIRLGEG